MSAVLTLLANTGFVAMLGAVCGLDMVSFPQAMIARPIVSATLAGAMVGRPGGGLLMGAILELIALETLPFGASKYAEWGSAGVVGGALYAAQPANTPGALSVAMLAALTTAIVSSSSMVVARRQNGRYALRLRDAIAQGDSTAVTTVQLYGLMTDLVRGGLITWLSLIIYTPVAQALVAHWRGDVVHSRAFVIAIASMVAARAVWKLFHNTVRAGWLFLVGLVIGGGILYVIQ